MNTKNKGFTLLEILLVMTLIGILIGILLVAINPNRQLAQARNLTRKKHITDIYNALELQKVKNRGVMLSTINTNYQEICDTGVRSITDALPSTSYCDGKIDLRVLVPTYIVSIPKDNNASGVGNTGYQVGKTESNQISIRSKNAELGQIIAINFIIPVVEATGGTVTNINVSGVNYRVHTFTSSGTLTVSTGGVVECLVVAGGGGGAGADGGGGGGGGGVIVNNNLNITDGNYTVTVGLGGAGTNSNSLNGGNGQNSVFSTLAAVGGGGGGRWGSPGISGGSGGGAGRDGSGATGGAGTAGQGNAGGSTAGSFYASAAGGGGASQAGGNGSATNGDPTDATVGGKGGDGVASSISGSLVYYGGGGGGSALYRTGGAGGLGGGGSSGNTTYGSPGSANTGGGGGGGRSGFGGSGGSGIIIIRYRI